MKKYKNYIRSSKLFNYLFWLRRVLFKLRYRARMFFPNIYVDKKLRIRDFKVNNINDFWRSLNLPLTPGRCLSDLFWLQLPWNEIEKELGEIHVLDLGCGSGVYGEKLIRYSNNNISSYLGIDVGKRENWEELEKKYDSFKLVLYDGKHIVNQIPESTNFFITQSALEHFEEYLLYLREIRNYILKYKKNVIQIHSIPAKVSLHLYGYHGCRTFTPRIISKITRLFKDFSYTMLFKAGGEACNSLHYEFITKSDKMQKNVRNDIKSNEYYKLLYKSIKRDMKFSTKNPNWYILIIHSNYENKLF